MTEPNQPIPQRIGDAERDQAIDCLREHAAQGRLDQTEFDERMERALAARVQTDIDPLFLDLPEPRPSRPSATPVPATAPQPGAQLQPQRTSQPDRRRFEVALGTVAALAWPLAILLMIATNSWAHIWWLWILPVIFTGAFGRYRHDRRR